MPNHVYVATRVDCDDQTDHILGVWADEDDLVEGMKDLFEWTSEVWQDGQWVMGKDGNGEGVSEIAYITCCKVQ
jgi:hypothetical protein